MREERDTGGQGMRNAQGKFLISLTVLGVAILLLWASLSGALGADDGRAATAAGLGGTFLLLTAGYFTVASAFAGVGAARLRAGVGVIARWRVPQETWRSYREIRLEQTGVSVPMLKGLLFNPRSRAAGNVEIICGKRSVLIDGCYFSVSPGRGAGMEGAGLVFTRPACIALVIAMIAGAHGSPRTDRWLLLLPIPDEARDRANEAVRHYAAEVANVRDIVDFARAAPGTARRLFWAILILSIAAAGAGILMEANDYPGTLPAFLGISGMMIALGTLIIGLKVRLSGRR